MYKKILDIIDQVRNRQYRTALSDDEIKLIREKVLNYLAGSKYKRRIDKMLDGIIRIQFDDEHNFIFGNLVTTEININEKLLSSNDTMTDDELWESIQIKFSDTVDEFVKQFIKECNECGDTETIKDLETIVASRTHLSEQIINFHKARVIATIIYPGLARYAANAYAIKKNNSELNQMILNNSYDVILAEVLRIAGENNSTIKAQAMVKKEKLAHQDLFTNAKKFAKLSRNKHYMSFLYRCTVAPLMEYSDVLVFAEFVEALVSGCLQWINIQQQPYRISEIDKELAVLEKYNTRKENDSNIHRLILEKQLFSTPKPLQRLLPFKELANKLEIDNKQIANYLVSILEVNRRTIKDNFDNLITQPKNICVVIKH